ncbi:MAG: tetratricopeptide repeat protein [Phycisphaeraceae bacterium]
MRPTASLGLRWLLVAGVAACGVVGCNTAAQRDAERDARARALALEADLLLDQNLDDEALETFTLALEENPELTEAHLGIGTIHRRRGDYDRAVEAFEEAIETEPDSFDAHYNLGLVRQLMGNVDVAVRTYLRALALNPDSFEANRDIASAYLQLGRANEAIPYAQRATELDRDSQAAWSNLAAAYSLADRYEDAVGAYRQAAELGELAEPVMLGLADAHIQLGNYDRAISVLELLLRRTNSANAHERLGLAMFKMRRFDEALNQYEAALELNAESTAALNGVGVCLMTEYLQGDRQNKALRRRAVEVWRNSLRLRPDQPRIIDLLARFGR